MAEKILVVDDTLVIRKLLMGILRKAGYELLEADDGEAALSLAEERHPDIILLDVVMPGRDGYAVCEELKSRSGVSDIPIIFLSGKSGAQSKIRGLELGAVDYITKPFDKGEVIARVRSQLKIQALTRSLRRANGDLLEKQRQIEQDLAAAGDIQRSLIPSRPPEIEGVDLAWRFHPCDRVGGDILNVSRLDEHHWAIYMVDVSGHGVPAAMVTVSVSQTLTSHLGGLLKAETPDPPHYRICRPAEVLVALDEEYPIDRFDKFFTIGYFVLDTREWELEYSCAAHPMPVLVHPDGSHEFLRAGGTIIGLGHRVPFEDGKVSVAPGDRLFLYTDGLVEFTAPDGECFGEERLAEVMASCGGQTVDATCDRVIDTVMEFGQGSSAQDDISLLVLEFGAAAGGASVEAVAATVPVEETRHPEVEQEKESPCE